LLFLISTTVTPEMVGKKLGVAGFIEVKTDTGIVSSDQINFLKRMRELGARAGIARSVSDAVAIARGEL
jgi:hypothetical protein